MVDIRNYSYVFDTSDFEKVSIVYSSHYDAHIKNYSIPEEDVASTGSKCDAILQDMPGPPPLYGSVSRYALAAFLFIFPCFTLIGSSFVIIAVYTHKRLHTITNAFVVSLAVADSLVAILVMPFGIYQQFNNKTWNLSRELCLITTSFDVMFTTTSIFNLSCLAIDRYLAICRPFDHERLTRGKVICMLSLCWIIPIFISFVPILNKWNTIGIEEFIDCAFPEEDLSHCVFVVNKVFATIGSVFAFYIPTSFILVCYIHIFKAARKQAYQISSLELTSHKQHRHGKLKHETKAAKTVGIIIGCFFICWFPFFGLNIIDPFINYKIPYIPWTIALWLGYINSMLNPILYYNFNKHYKVAFRRLLSCKVCRGVSEFEYETVQSSYHTEYIQSTRNSISSKLAYHRNS
ncbi:5-hydroxytryptamine receptor 4-like [Ruditapes philippinarum]|uniref:5-hydroxytryptamine receptor 4-like n=1 Tax=Ruditapes philippinarum TaxID=129788 RepID=UPI00295B4381|nr:5-hydroxytryptamine receptor 4-like [Ruditapes philippinarum]